MAMLQRLELEDLSNGIPVISEMAAGFYIENCMVCFDQNGHRSGVNLAVTHVDGTETVQINWRGEVTEQLKMSYRENTSATNHAACAIALMLVREFTEFTAVEQSVIGTSIDYMLVKKKRQNDDLLFNQAARLEVSGILKESSNNSLESRIREKVKRLKRSGNLPDYIAVVEFGAPKSKLVRHEHDSRVA